MTIKTLSGQLIAIVNRLAAIPITIAAGETFPSVTAGIIPVITIGKMVSRKIVAASIPGMQYIVHGCRHSLDVSRMRNAYLGRKYGM